MRAHVRIVDAKGNIVGDPGEIVVVPRKGEQIKQGADTYTVTEVTHEFEAVGKKDVFHKIAVQVRETSVKQG